MLYSTKTAEQKRIDLRETLKQGGAQQFPGAFTPLTAKLIQEKGFPGVYISGGVLANELGLPDVGLTTLTEVAVRGGQIARLTDLPCLIDADTGFGEPMNVARTVQEFENAGLAGCHIEDQFNPKRCGHLDGKNMVDLDTAVKRIAAAVDARRDPNFLIMARTDLRAVEGLDAAIARMKALVEAGADAIFPEALKDLGEFETVCRELAPLGVPVLANMTEFGRTPFFTASEFEEMGYAMVIWPVSHLRVAAKAIEELYAAIRRDGGTQNMVDRMQTRAELYETIDYAAYEALDATLVKTVVPAAMPQRD